MNRQQIFDKVCHHLVVKQKKKAGGTSLGGVFLCKYRAGDDATCAIGCLIPKKDYNPEFDHSGAIKENNLVKEYLEKNGVSVKRGLEFLSDLQFAHDNVSSYEDFVDVVSNNLRRIAQKYHLRQPKCIKK